MKKQNSPNHLLLILISYLAFISLGLPDGLLGVSWPFISERLQVPLDSLGILLIGFVAGYLSTSTTSGKIMTKIPLGFLLSGSCALTGLSLLGFAFLDQWFLIVMASFFLGSGGGAIDTSINVFAASKFSPSVVNWLHAFYGVGATSGPIIITLLLVRGQEWSYGYIAVGTVQIGLAFIFLMTLRYWKVESVEEKQSPAASYRETLRLPLVWISIFIFFVYTGLEIGVGQWIFTVLTASRNLDPEQAGFWTTAYWGSLTAGRILFGFVLTKFKIQSVLLGAFLGIITGALLLVINQSHFLSLAGIILIGASNAPVFPCLISITPKAFGERFSGNIIGFQISGAMIGGALLPAFGGFLTQYFGWEIIPLTYLVEALLLLTLYLVLADKRKDLR